MKKILLGLVLGLFVLFAFDFCTKAPPPKPDCEINSYGSVHVANQTGYDLWVDVTWGNVVENDEYKLRPGNARKYTKIPAGNIEIWASFDGNSWIYDIDNLSVCEDMTFTWYLNNAKSTEKTLFLRNDVTGEELNPTRKDKH